MLIGTGKFSPKKHQIGSLPSMQLVEEMLENSELYLLLSSALQNDCEEGVHLLTLNPDNFCL